MSGLLAAAAAFILMHRGISGSPLRAVLVGRLGETAYARLFQLASVAALVWLGVAYAGASAPGATAALWTVPRAMQVLQLALQPLALLMITAGATTRNPGTFRQESAADRDDAARGLLRVTRHPFLWGIALFAAGHVLAAPSPRNLVLFGTLLVVALTGTRSIDAKRRRSLGTKWEAFAATTSNLPFAAILAKRQTFRPSEIGWSRLLAALALFALLVAAHPYLFGKPALARAAAGPTAWAPEAASTPS